MPLPPTVLSRRYLFPKGDPEFYARVGAALGLMVTGKLLNISVPFIFKHAGAFVVDTRGDVAFKGALQAATCLALRWPGLTSFLPRFLPLFHRSRCSDA